MKSVLVLLVCAGAMGATAPARADDVIAEINRAKAAYLNGNYAEAKQSLDLAGQLVVEHKAKALRGVLPPPFLGWTATDKAQDDSGAVTAPAALLGGITVGRTYERDRKICAVNIAGDSPILAMVSMFLANPTLAQASGARIQRIGNQRAVVTQDNEVQVMTANNYLVTITGDCTLADKLAYAGAVDYTKLAAF